MDNTYAFTYIIGYRHSLERMQNLRRVLDWLSGFNNIEVLLIEQDKHSKISHLNLRAKHIFIKSNMPYNKSHTFNIGTKYSKSNIIVYGDSDLIMNPNDLINGLNNIKHYEMVNPYNSVIDLTSQESTMPMEILYNINRPGRGETDIQKVPLCGGICIFRKEAIQRIGGWNEDFIGWGGEDDAQSIKVKNFLTWIELNAKCYHLYHDRPSPDMKWYQRNLQILQRISQMDKNQLQRMISMQNLKNGLKNKYDNF